MRIDNGAIVIVVWVLAVITLSSAKKKALSFSENERFSAPLDSIQQKKSLFRKEYKEKLDILESSILETRKEISKKKGQQQVQWNQELDALEESRIKLLGELDASENDATAHWDQFANEFRDQYDETESKVRNFFKK